MSLQSGCDETLKRMNRRYTTEQFREIVKRLRNAYNDVNLTTDIIVGFPGETEEEFTKTSYDLIEKAAEEICEFVLLNYPLVKKVKLLLKKPWAPTRKHVEYVAVEIERKWNKVYIAAGSNLGDKEETLKEAIDKTRNGQKIEIIYK